MKHASVDGRGVNVQLSDLSEEDFGLAIDVGQVGWDIETSGLDWKDSEIGTCQLSIGPDRIVVVQIHGGVPCRLVKLLADERVSKVFHHATFDVRFMVYKWRGHAANVACTKIASKILDPRRTDHSLKALLWTHLRIEIDKGQRLSNWLGEHLTERQVAYAAHDVMYVVPLLRQLEKQLVGKDRLYLCRACFAHIPVRAQLDVGGYGDVYEY